MVGVEVILEVNLALGNTNLTPFLTSQRKARKIERILRKLVKLGTKLLLVASCLVDNQAEGAEVMDVLSVDLMEEEVVVVDITMIMEKNMKSETGVMIISTRVAVERFPRGCSVDAMIETAAEREMK